MNNLGKWPPLNCLKGFEAAARLNSFSQAARELNMTQSAISHQIKTLETYLDQELFIRVNRKVVLSDAGLDLLATTEECFDVLAGGFKRLEQYKKPNQIIVHTSSAFASDWLVLRLNDFRTLYDDIDIWLYTTDSEPDLELAEVHVAILYGQGRWPGMASNKMFIDFLVPLCSPAHPIMKLKEIEAHELTNFTLLHSEQRETWQTWFASIGLEDLNPIIGPTFSNPSLMLQAAIQGQGIVLGSAVLAANHLKDGSLVSPYPQAVKSRNGFYLVTKYGGLDSPKLELFLNWINSQSEIFANQRYRELETQFGLGKPE